MLHAFELELVSEPVSAREIVEQPDLALSPGEAWSDAALAGIGSLDPEARQGWRSLLLHGAKASGGKPAAKWR